MIQECDPKAAAAAAFPAEGGTNGKFRRAARATSPRYRDAFQECEPRTGSRNAIQEQQPQLHALQKEALLETSAAPHAVATSLSYRAVFDERDPGI